jgi:hypothetical protein
MKAGEKHRTQRRPGRRSVPAPALLTVITCPACGSEVDLWTCEEETRCLACDQEIYKKQRIDH